MAPDGGNNKKKDNRLLHILHKQIEFLADAIDSSKNEKVKQHGELSRGMLVAVSHACPE